MAIAAGILFPFIEGTIELTIALTFGPDAARSVLGALAGGMITFTGFVFSIMLLAVQFGSSQFSPRMLRLFLRDRTTQIALGTFIATFLYSLLLLSSIGTPANPDFVPHASVLVAFVLLLASMVLFLQLVANTTSGLRVPTVLGHIGREALGLLPVERVAGAVICWSTICDSKPCTRKHCPAKCATGLPCANR
jgi:uncharacterized membrane protein